MSAERKFPIGVSACLLGDEVRYNGGHKRDRYITDVLVEFVEYVRVCPELEFGLGVPRETLRLHRAGDDVRMKGNDSGADITAGMRDFSRRRVAKLAPAALRGFILKKGSPSCGMERVKVYDHNLVPSNEGTGLFAAALVAALPNLPVEEEGRLNDPRLRENFITRIFAYDRWLKLRENSPRPRDLVAFHTAHKMLLLAHEPEGYRRLGPMVARAGDADLEPMLDEYERRFMASLSKVATARRHINVLEHLSGFLKQALSAQEKRELHGLFEEYRQGWVPLVAVLSLLNHHLGRVGHEWVDAQAYLNPYPKSLGLRSGL